MGNTVLVTGSTGFVGRRLLQHIHSGPRYTPRAVVRTVNSGLSGIYDTVMVKSISADTDWCSALKGASVVVHLAARVHAMRDAASNPIEEYRRINVAGTLQLAQQAAISGIRRFVYLSTIKVNGECTSPAIPFQPDDPAIAMDAYSISKKEAEDGLISLARETGMEVVIIRPPLVYGPGVKANFAVLMDLIYKGIPLPFGAVQSNLRSYIGIDNLVDLIDTCIDHPAAANQVLLASDDEDLSTAELIRRLALAMNKSANLIPVPIWMLRTGAVLFGKREVAQRLLDFLQVDITKTRELLGWSPPVSVDEGLRRAVAPLLKKH